MRNLNLICLIFIFVLQNANARDTLFFDKPLKESFILWRVQFQPNGYLKIDSVLRGNYFVKEEWKVAAFSYIMQEKFIGLEDSTIKINTNYLLLARANRLTYQNVIFIRGFCCVFLDTPKNRKMLSKKWDETVIIYKYPESKYDPKSSKNARGVDAKDLIFE